jgi:arylsulfatase
MKSRLFVSAILLPVTVAVIAAVCAATATAQTVPDRTTLPIPEPQYPHSTVLDARNAEPLPRFEVRAPEGAPNVLIVLIDDMGFSQSGAFGGWSLYLKDGKPTCTYNFLGLQPFTIAASKPVPAGKATIRFELAYDGGGLGKGGAATIFVNGEKVAEGRIERTQSMAFSADEGADVGKDGETPIVEDYGIPAPYKFTGTIDKITIDLKEMKAADKAEENKLRAEAAHKKALSD